jgi:hypothetical protein
VRAARTGGKIGARPRNGGRRRPSKSTLKDQALLIIVSYRTKGDTFQRFFINFVEVCVFRRIEILLKYWGS